MSTAQRKRKSDSGNSRRTRKRRAGHCSTTTMATAPETIEVEESGEEVVDLTCESLEPVVVDLTHNDSVVIVEDNSSQRRNPGVSQQTASCILSSDDEDSRDTDIFVTSRVSRDTSSVEQEGSRFTSGKVSCPICLDGYSEIVQSKRLIVATKCGHIFCSQCIRDALKSASSCPTCRKKLTHKQYHPIYI
ncbi:E3 ubiquitin- ligase RNF4 isoform X1 [Pelobates cultripes]|uniref:E3 ubiquitin-protein ligase RNF4 n=1 Tax=Pelobates cultripes TaxID=61616 RepID=A0AAD1SGY0_PELCU|nr:E3 ubiquitin- ligase RNF4 isoform X1 [Pelobates cultripes]